MRRLLYAALSVAAVLLSTTALGTQPAAASTWTSGYCPTSKGVTVVVDFTAFHGGVQTRCYSSATSSTTGVTALQGAGFDPVGTAKYQLQFVCRIQGLPTEKDDSCVNTPPESAYWSYWYASNGAGWTYSTKGASAHHVIPGGFEGWRFGNGSSPPNKSTDRPAPIVLPTFHMGPAASTTASHHTSSTSKSSSPTSKATAKKTATPTATSTDPSDAVATPAGTNSSSDPPQAGGKSGPTDPGGGSSPWPFLIGVVVVAGVGGGAWLVVYQRRRVGGL